MKPKYVECIECHKLFPPQTPVHNLCTQECREKYLDRPLSERKQNLPKTETTKERMARARIANLGK